MPADGWLEWEVRGRPLAGEPVSGDAAVVSTNDTRTLLTVVDGLGHGPEAAAATDVARATLVENASEPLEPLLVLCHQALRKTRGVAMTMATVDHGTGAMQWLGVGNVEGVLVRGNQERRPRLEAVFHFPGVVGYRLPKVSVHANQLDPDDLVVLASDGIASSFFDDLGPTTAIDRLADRIVAGHARAEDDALVLVARLLPGGVLQ